MSARNFLSRSSRELWSDVVSPVDPLLLGGVRERQTRGRGMQDKDDSLAAGLDHHGRGLAGHWGSCWGISGYNSCLLCVLGIVEKKAKEPAVVYFRDCKASFSFFCGMQKRTEDERKENL